MSAVNIVRSDAPILLVQIRAISEELRMAELEPILDRKQYRILNDGPGREVVVHDDFDDCPVFETVAKAEAHIAWLIGAEEAE